MNTFFTVKVIIITAGILLLNACSNKLSTSPNNKSFPQACLDSSNQFQFVKGVIGSANGSYNDDRKFYYPIESKDGFIKHDFNQDGFVDYIFLERSPNKNNTRLMTCLSHSNKQYQRQTTPYTIREYKKPSLYVEQTRIKLKGNTLSINFSTHAHNDGGEAETAYYHFNKQRNDFVLTKFEYSAYGEVFPEIYQAYDFNKQNYKEETGCSFAFNPSAMGYNPNCKPRKIKQCLKSSKNITIRKRINKDDFEKLIKKCF